MAGDASRLENGGDPFARDWDVAVFGAGYAGYAAATTAAAAGLATILIDRNCSLLWESAIARFPEAGGAPPEMRPFLHAAECATGIADDWIDPGSAEWLACELLAETGVRPLFFAAPVAAGPARDGTLASVTIALRDRLATLRASAWIDATDDAILARLCDPGIPAPRPARLVTHLFLQNIRWHGARQFEIPTGRRATRAFLADSRWSSERILRIESAASEGAVDADLAGRIFKSLSARLGDDSGALLSHWSFSPYPIYRRPRSAAKPPCGNMALAVPALSRMPSGTLGDRFALGIAAFGEIAGAARNHGSRAGHPDTPATPHPLREIAADVCVVGLGASGLPSAVAAARAGARVVAIEASPAPGGIATMGGVPSYYRGLPGGLQDELDAATERLSGAIEPGAPVPGKYNPFARLAASRSMLESAGVEVILRSSAVPGTAMVENGRIASVLASTPDGVARISAKCWIDATGEAFLSRDAGVPFSAGRQGDGLMNPFGQVWGAFGFTEPNRLGRFISTPDSGFVDPSDSVALTRARLSAAHALVEGSCVRTSNAFNRTTGLFPLIGIRRGPLVRTRRELTLDDLVLHTRFPDSIGATAGHVDSHLRDAFAESGDLCFYYWCAGLWDWPTACEIPYRALLPVGIDNLWVPCRAGGVDPDSSYAFRMQRDMQRKGEAAGLAAAIAARRGCASADVPIRELQAALRRTGALASCRRGSSNFATGNRPAGPVPKTSPSSVAAALEGPDAGILLWRLYRSDHGALPPILRPLLEDSGRAGDRAALLLGAIGDTAAVPRLERAASGAAGQKPFTMVPLATAAIWALGCCGGRETLRLLAGIACDPGRDAMARLSALWGIGTIASRLGPPPGAQSFADALDRGTRDLEAALAPPRPGQRAAALRRITSPR